MSDVTYCIHGPWTNHQNATPDHHNGKGPCDEVCACAKRSANKAIAQSQGDIAIQSAEEFFEWSQTTDGSIKYFFVSDEECWEMHDLAQTTISRIAGTMKLHAA